MTYRIVVGGSVKTIKRDFEEARRVAQIEALGSGKMVEIEEAEAGNKWTSVELVSSNGSEVSIGEYHSLPDTLFGSHRSRHLEQVFQHPVNFGGGEFHAPGTAKPRAFG
ncbi:MAG: hypothetical protein V1820_05775 [archaeon]